MSFVDSQDVIDHWVATWLHVRDITASQVDGWPLVHVAGPSRETELICLDPGAATFASLMRHVVDDPRAMLTAVALDTAPYLDVPRPTGVRVDRDDETLMTAVFTPHRPPVAPLGLRARWDVDDHRSTCSLETGDAVAAVGTVGVVGTTATFDRIETSPSFRRRGLGRYVVQALTQHAVDRGATRGVLAASADGRALYETLGWTVRLQLLSLMGT